MVLSWLRAGSKQDGRPASASPSTSASAATPQYRDALLAAADRAGRLVGAVHELAARVESEAKTHDWVEGEVLALFRDGVSAWSSLFAYGLLRLRHDVLRGDGSDVTGGSLRNEWAMASAKLAEQVAGHDAAGVGDATRLRPTIANMLDQYDEAAAASAANVRQLTADGEGSGERPYGPFHELASHGFGGPADGAELAARFEALIDALTPAVDTHIRQIYG